MCVKKIHHSLNRRICICFTVYVVFGLRINCGVLGHKNHTFPPEHHAEALYANLTKDDFLYPQNLSKLLDHLNISPNKRGEHLDHNHSQQSEIQEPECYTAEQMVGFFAPAVHLNKSQFVSLLPTIVYELHTHACHPDHVNSKIVPANSRDWKAIVACVVAVIVLGSSGLIVVALVPLMSRSFYNVVTQFLIALSVGSLTGDAFLHLIPHALSGEHSHGHESDQMHGHHNEKAEENSHRNMVMKSLVALLGIYAFFLTERLTILCQNRTSRKKMKRLAQAAHVFDEDMPGDKTLGYQRVIAQTPYRNGYLHPETSKSAEQSRSDALVGGAQETSKSKNSLQTHTRQLSVPEGLSTAHPEPLSHVDNQLCNRPPERPMDNTRCVDYLKCTFSPADGFTRAHSGTLGPAGSNVKHVSGSTPHFWLLTSTATVGTPTARAEEANSEDPTMKKTATSTGITPSIDNNTVTGDVVTWQKQLQTNSPTVFLNDTEQQPTHPHRDKPHGHHHGHSHDLSSVKAIAYTIIAGDGLHNFCDGIAIGAAFANDLRGGLSTSIAVLCHELPHELGDFAVLLHAGMSVKTALFYNLLSSVLCAAGTAIGLLLGQMESVDAWLFMLTAGMFVYIALVDMMPELTTNRLKGHRYCHQPTVLFLWQNLGIFLGYVVMLLISLFEDRMI